MLKTDADYGLTDIILYYDDESLCEQRIRNYINDVVLTYPYLGSKLWDVILQMAAVPNHPLNAEHEDTS